MIRALVFDLDGTLVDSVADLARALNAMLAELAREPVSEASVRHWVGNGIENLVRRALWRDLHGADLPDGEYQPALAAFRRHYAICLAAPQTPLYPGVRQTLDQLTASGYPLALVTNKAQQFTAALLEQLDLSRYFQLVICGDSLPHKKPHPAPLLEVVRQLSSGVTAELAAEQLLMVGDSSNDVLAARAAGCPVAGLSYGYNHGEPIDRSAPDVVLDNISGLLPWLAQRNGG